MSTYRFLLTNPKTTSQGSTYDSIMWVAEFDLGQWNNLTRARRRFRDLCRKKCPQAYHAPGRKIQCHVVRANPDAR